MKTIKEIYKNFLIFCKKLCRKDEDSFNAGNIYAITRYGKIMTKEQILKIIIEDIVCDIRSKSREKKYSLSVDITLENKEFVDQVCEYFKTKKFKVSRLDSSSDPELNNYGVILIIWERDNNKIE